MNKAFTSRLPSFKFFPLSNHCGYDKLFEFVEEVKPKSVFTYHGFDEEFASALRKKLGLNSHILKRKRQQLYLTEYF
jgi:Cft2 family RNA processing exonuclease